MPQKDAPKTVMVVVPRIETTKRSLFHEQEQRVSLLGKEPQSEFTDHVSSIALLNLFTIFSMNIIFIMECFNIFSINIAFSIEYFEAF